MNKVHVSVIKLCRHGLFQCSLCVLIKSVKKKVLLQNRRIDSPNILQTIDSNESIGDRSQATNSHLPSLSEVHPLMEWIFA